MLLNPHSAVPFRFDAGRVGCLLVHGFTGSPFEMRGIGEHLAREGVTAVGPLLPGHGTTEAALNETTWRSWFDTVVAAYDELSERCTPVYVAGLSMGGVLSLHLAAHRPVAGVVALAAFLRPADWRVPLARIVRYVRPIDPKGGLDIQDPAGRASFSGYDSHPTWAACEMLALCEHLRSDLAEVRCPALLMHGRLDKTIDLEQMDILMRMIGSKRKWRYVLERTGHVVPLDYDRQFVQDTIARFVAMGGSLDVPASAAEQPVAVAAS